MRNIPSFSEFNFWFIKTGTCEYDVFDLNQGDIVGHVSDQSDPIVSCATGIDSDAIQSDFIKFQQRPEYEVYNFDLLVENQDFSFDTLKSVYNNLLAGCMLLKAKQNHVDPDIVLPRVEKCLSWLDRTDFYTAPGSTIYHNSEPSGLVKHTLVVAHRVIELHRLPKFMSNVNLEDALFVALVHDWCKIGLYESYMRNVKNEETGVWEKVQAYRRKDPSFPLGHGAASMYLAGKFVNLSLEEACAIRWHMGEYNVADNEMNELHAANEQMPLVQLIQFADRLSITKY